MKHTLKALAAPLSLVALLAACASSSAPPVEPAASPELAEAAPAPIAGLDRVPERWRAPFVAWLATDDGVYTEVTEADEVSNGAILVLTRRIEVGERCRQGPVRVEILEETPGYPSVDATHFGTECCPGRGCEPDPITYFLRYLRAAAASDHAALAALVPAEGHLDYALSSEEDANRRFTRAEVAAGGFTAPGCGFMYTFPECDAADPDTGEFRCQCMGGGYQVYYFWRPEGGGAVVYAIEESSH